MSRLILMCLTVAGTTIGLATSASAVVVWQIEGQIRTANNTTTFSPELLALGIDVGTPISGWFEMDETVPDSDPAADHGVYGNFLWSGELSVGSTTIDLQYGGIIDTLVVNSSLRTIQSVDVYGNISGGASASSPDLDVQFGFFELVATQPGVITGDAFPVTPPDLALLSTFDDLFPFPLLTSFGFSTPTDSVVRAEISSIQLIPEPSTALLVGVGVAGMAATRRGRRSA